MKQTIRKTITVLLALVMVLTLLPTVTVTARADDPISLGNETIPTLSDSETPLTLQAITKGTILVNSPKPGMQYSLNGATKTDVTTDAITVSAGNTVAFYGSADSYFGTTISGGSAQCYIYGNIMSLINATGFASATALTGDSAFYGFFAGNECLLSHQSRKLVLPATTLTNSCYANMFYGCTGLTTAPELPATNLTNSCYANMFTGCTGLTTAPELPATNLTNSCYKDMFRGCTNLTTAPALPATTLAERCYYNMFKGCMGLTTAPELPATTLVKQCYLSMFHDCTNLNAVTCLATDISVKNATSNWLKNVAFTGTFTKASGTDWPTDSPSGIPEGWTAVDYATTPDVTTTSVTYLDAQVDDTTHAVTYTPATCTDYTPVASDTEAVTWGTAGETTWYVVQEDVTIDNTVTFYGDVRLILCDGATLTVNSVTEDGNAITNSGSGSLTVYAQSTGENAGALKATAQKGSAILADGCAVTVNGGKVTATMGADDGNGYAGIDVKNGSLTINGGVVNASVTGLYIGIRAEKAPVTINGGSVTAEGNMFGINLNETVMTMNGGSLAANSGMICGISGPNASLAITGGTVTTESGFTGINVATVSISGGDLTIKNGINANYDVSISGGDVTIKKGISGGNVSISGGSVKIDSADSAAIFANETVTISGGAVEATGQTYGIMTWNGDVTITGGDVTASATNDMAVNSQNGAVVIGPGLRVDAGDNESAAVKVTKAFPGSHPQKWAHIYEITNSTYTPGELAKGKKLTVTAASGDDFALVCEGKGQIGYYLAATATDTQPTTTWTFTALDDDPATQPMGVIVSETDYNSARPGTYTDTVTFTAQVEEAAALQKLTVPAYVWSDEVQEAVKVDVDFYYMPNETWKQAIENHPENAGWSTFDNSFDVFISKGEKYTDATRGINDFYIIDENADMVDFDLPVDPTITIRLVDPAI